MWVNRRANNRAFIEIKPVEESFQEVVEKLNGKNVPVGIRRTTITFNTSATELQTNGDLHEWLGARLAPSSMKAAEPPVANIGTGD